MSEPFSLPDTLIFMPRGVISSAFKRAIRIALLNVIRFCSWLTIRLARNVESKSLSVILVIFIEICRFEGINFFISLTKLLIPYSMKN